MFLNTINAGVGARKPKTRVGRGIGSGIGKTCGRGHKGQTSRSGGYHKTGFEGGQMPLQRRLPKFGFRSRKSLFNAEIRTSELNKMTNDVVDMQSLFEAGLIGAEVKDVKIFLSGQINKALTIKGLRISKGAKAAIEAAGGKVED